MARTGDDILVAFLETQTVGYEFERRRQNWPYHVTLVSWFGCDHESALDEQLAEGLRVQQAFTAELGQEELFGEGNDIPVHVITDQKRLADLHRKLTGIVSQMAVRLPENPWVGDAYRAHVTRHGDGGDLATGHAFEIDSVYRVHLLPDNICRVAGRILLGGSDETAA